MRRPALLGACLGWVAAAGWAAPHWFSIVAAGIGLTYLVLAVRPTRKLEVTITPEDSPFKDKRDWTPGGRPV